MRVALVAILVLPTLGACVDLEGAPTACSQFGRCTDDAAADSADSGGDVLADTSDASDAVDADAKPDGGDTGPCVAGGTRCADTMTMQTCGATGTWSDETCAIGCGGNKCLKVRQLIANPFCALLSDSTVRCWGFNLDRALGPGPAEVLKPTPVVGVSDVAQIAGGYSVTAARLNDGKMIWWGRIPTKKSPTIESPILVDGVSGVVDIAMGLWHACAKWADGTVRCWGQGEEGQLGNGLAKDSFAPALVEVPGAKGALQLGASFFESYALLVGEARGWGQNIAGQLGTAKDGKTLTPQAGYFGATQLAPGLQFSCARMSDGTAKCAGLNDDGQLGDGTKVSSSTPVAVKGLTGVKQVSAGSAHACAVLDSGGLRCWGNNVSGQLGDGTTTSSPTPITVPASILPAAGVKFVAVSGGDADSTTCVLGVDEVTVLCWGSNLAGSLGAGLDPAVYPKKLTSVGLAW